MTAVLALTVALADVPAASADPPPPSAEPISGTIVTVDGSPVAGAVVSLSRNDSADVFTSETTGPTGGFSLTVPGGIYALTVRASGYATRVVSQVGLAPFTEDLVVVPPGTSKVTGRLVDHRAVSVSGAFVTVGPATVKTASDGSFALALANNVYAVRIDSPAQLPGPSGPDIPPQQWSWSTADTFVVDRDRALGPVVMPAPVHLSLTVTDTGGAPVAHATVQDAALGGIAPGIATIGGSTFEQGSMMYNHGTTDANGLARLTYWPTPSTQITVTPPAGSRSAATTLPVFPVTQDTSRAVTLPDASVVTGVLVDDRGAVAPRVSVSIGSATAVSAADGGFSLAVADGTYAVTLEGPVLSDPSAPGPDMPNGQWLLTTAGTFQVNGDQDLGRVALPAPAHLTVPVRDPRGQPVLGARLQDGADSDVYPGLLSFAGQSVASGNQYLATAVTDASGVAVLAYWPTPREQVLVTPPVGEALGGVLMPSLDLTTDATRPVTLPTAGAVSGILVDDHGAAVAGVTVSLTGPTPTKITTTTALDGSFTLFAVPDTYSLSVGVYEAASTPVTTGLDVPNGLWDLDTTSSLVVSGGHDLGQIALPTPDRLSVTILDTMGNPVPGGVLSDVGWDDVTVTGTLAGQAITSGQETGETATTDRAGVARLVFWPTSSTAPTFTPAAGSMLPVVTLPSIQLDGDTAVTASFQADGTVSESLTPAPTSTRGEDVATTIAPGALVISVDDTGPVVLPSPGLNSDGLYLTTSGRLHPVTVTDTRAGDPGWVVSGQVSDFRNTTGPTLTPIAGVDLGWTPNVIDSSSGRVVAGTVVAPATPPLAADPEAAVPGVGLQVARALAGAAAGAGTGTTHIGAGLTLNVPTTVIAGTYDATLTLTAI